MQAALRFLARKRSTYHLAVAFSCALGDKVGAQRFAEKALKVVGCKDWNYELLALMQKQELKVSRGMRAYLDSLPTWMERHQKPGRRRDVAGLTCAHSHDVGDAIAKHISASDPLGLLDEGGGI